LKTSCSEYQALMGDITVLCMVSTNESEWKLSFFH
jgi:hypothetical protein